MRLLFSSIIILCALHLSGQKDIEIIKTKHEDRSVSIAVKNNSDIDYSIEPHFNLTGMAFEKELESSVIVPAKSKVSLCKLIATEKKSNYKVRYSATPIDDNKNYSGTKEVLFYSRNEDSKSTEIRNYFEKHKIPFSEYNISFSDEAEVGYKTLLQKMGLKKSTKTPLLIIDNEAYHSIRDVKKFLAVTFE